MQNIQNTALFLHGFRGVGKSTIGEQVARHLGWEYIEMDALLEGRAGMKISALTKNGTDWVPFRQMEQDLLRELVIRTHIVVSTGGGACVNGIRLPNSEETFGQQNARMMKEAEEKGALSVLITATPEVVEKRIRKQEESKTETTRPVLNPEKAKELEALLKKYKDDPAKQKEIIVQFIVEDAMNMYVARQPLYAKITDEVVDTSTISIPKAVEAVLDIMCTGK